MHTLKLSQKFSLDSVAFLSELVKDTNWKNYFLYVLFWYNPINYSNFVDKIQTNKSNGLFNHQVLHFNKNSCNLYHKPQNIQLSQGMKVNDE
jgi:hypothetical protein